MPSPEFRRGQLAALEVAMTVICPTCRRAFYGPTSLNRIREDVPWLDGDMATAKHSAKRVCKAAPLIPLYLMLSEVSNA